MLMSHDKCVSQPIQFAVHSAWYHRFDAGAQRGAVGGQKVGG